MRTTYARIRAASLPTSRILIPTLLLAAMLLAGCGLFGAASTAPTPLPTRTPLPTFTPTADAVVREATPAAVVAETPATGVTTADAPAPTPEPVPTATPLPEPKLRITGDIVNLRSGPSVDYEVVATVRQGESFPITAKSPGGDWWQISWIDGQSGWVFSDLAVAENASTVPVATDLPAEPAPASEIVPASTPVAVDAPAEAPGEPAVAAPPPDPGASSEGYFDPNAQYQIVHFKVLGLGENNGGIRDSSAQHHIFVTVLDQNGHGVDGAVVKNLVGEKGEVETGGKGPGKAEITMYWEPFKLAVASDPSGPVTSQISNQMGLAFPHLPDIVGKLGGLDYEYAVCPTLEVNCAWPIQAVHFSYEITFQKVK
ncbi:MAG: SH3 domain-containing protein [Caldilineaceae bacterium]|nr:SH3 domain-containing protein [Caldilineaceae bacterium]